jgi:hypothetical protein
MQTNFIKERKLEKNPYVVSHSNFIVESWKRVEKILFHHPYLVQFLGDQAKRLESIITNKKGME